MIGMLQLLFLVGLYPKYSSTVDIALVALLAGLPAVVNAKYFRNQSIHTTDSVVVVTAGSWSSGWWHWMVAGIQSQGMTSSLSYYISTV